MEMTWEELIFPFDERRDLVTPGDKQTTINYCVEQFVEIGNAAIAERGAFRVALSGGSTPKQIFEMLATKEWASKLDWSKVWLFWGDERNVPPNHPDSNFRMAMQAGLNSVEIPENQIFRMPADESLEHGALRYEESILEHVPEGVFDLVQLGMGVDGHTASLFPETHALHTHDRSVAANYIPTKDSWRMTLTYSCINRSRHLAIYVIGESKAEMLVKVLEGPYQPDHLPVQRIGTTTHKALWIADDTAVAKLLENQQT